MEKGQEDRVGRRVKVVVKRIVAVVWILIILVRIGFVTVFHQLK